jgi:VanZ family protein
MRFPDRCARALLLAAWMVLIVYWSGQNNLPIDQPVVANIFHGFQHRFAHLVAFGLLGLLARWALDGLPRSALLAICVASIFGATDEWHQSFTAGRHSGIDDWAFDTASAAAAVYAWMLLTSTRLRAPLRALAPVAVSAAFALGVGLAVGSAALPSDISRPSLRGLAGQAAHGAINVARTARDAARQLRSNVSG